MKIAIFSDTFSSINGVANVTHKSALALEKIGHDIKIFTVSDKNKSNLDYRANGKSLVINLPSLPFWGYQNERFALPFGLAIRKIKEFKPQIIHTHTPFSVGWEAILSATLFRVPVVGTHHTFYDHYLKHIKMGYNWAKKPAWKYTVAYYNRCDLVLSPTESLANELKKYGLKKPIEIMPNPVDTQLFRPLTDSAEKNKLKSLFGIKNQSLVYMGRVSYEKNIDKLIKAVALLSKEIPDIKLMIIGDGPEMSNLKKLAYDLGISDKINFLGFRHNQELVEALQANDIFLTASKSENMPLSILEAMSTGLPIIAVSALGIPEIVRDDVNGFLTSTDKPEEIAAITLELLKSKKQLKKFSLASRKLALDYSQERIAESLEKVYTRLAKS